MSPDISLRDVRALALAADLVIATCEGEAQDRIDETELGRRMAESDPWILAGALAAIASVLLLGRDHHAILSEMVESLSGEVP